MSGFGASDACGKLDLTRGYLSREWRRQRCQGRLVSGYTVSSALVNVLVLYFLSMFDAGKLNENSNAVKHLRPLYHVF